MAVHNGERYVRLAIDSVLSQDFQDLELIIVDDGSTDETPAIVASCADERIVYVRNDINIGQTRSLNVGLARARADLVARIDADDLYLPGKLTRQYALMASRPDIAVCGTAAIKIDADGKAFGRYVPPSRPNDIRFCLCQRVPVCHVSVLMRRDIVLRHGGYDERYLYAADYALWSSLAQAGGVIANLDEPLMAYREFTQSLGAQHKLGRNGDEGAKIIHANAAALAGLSLSFDECRAIALMYFPAARLSSDALARAYLNLLVVAKSIYGRPPLRARLELFGLLCWTLLKRATDRQGAPGEDFLWTAARTFARNPTIPVACFLAWCGARLGHERAHRLKEVVMPVVMRRLR